jgi:hypothetical protein
VIVWEFWNGSSWATLTDIYDLDNQTDTSGGRPFVTTTPYGGPPALPLSISNTPVPATWASTTVKGVAGYWIRARIATGKATSITSVPRGASAGINHVVGDTLVPCTAVVRERTAPSAGYFTVLDKAYEGTTYPYQFFPDTPADNDAAYFRMGTSAAPAFIALYVAIGRAAKYANAGVVVWEYYNGSTWVTLPGVTDGTNPDDATGGRPFIDDGIVGAASSADWASVSVSTFGAGYWIRCRIKVGQAASVTRVPILASEGPTRIYVYDELQNELVSYYDPRNLRGAYITAMHELALPTGNPRMLIGLSDGRTLSFPSENFYDTESTTLHLNYPTMQELYIGQEGRQLGKTITKLWTHVGALGGTLRMEVAGVATGTEDVDTEGMKGKDIVLADTVDESGPEFDPFLQGHFAKVRFSTTASDAASPEWEIIDLFVDMQG